MGEGGEAASPDVDHCLLQTHLSGQGTSRQIKGEVKIPINDRPPARSFPFHFLSSVHADLEFMAEPISSFFLKNNLGLDSNFWFGTCGAKGQKEKNQGVHARISRYLDDEILIMSEVKNTQCLCYALNP